eukprot:2003188-Amphidinium_carterae.1
MVPEDAEEQEEARPAKTAAVPFTHLPPARWTSTSVPGMPPSGRGARCVSRAEVLDHSTVL